MKNFIFFAKSNPKFSLSLINELKSLTGIQKINSIKNKGLNLIKFEAPLEKIWKILLYSRLTEDLKIQIKENINIKY
jgi:hypothetical protein